MSKKNGKGAANRKATHAIRKARKAKSIARCEAGKSLDAQAEALEQRRLGLAILDAHEATRDGAVRLRGLVSLTAAGLNKQIEGLAQDATAIVQKAVEQFARIESASVDATTRLDKLADDNTETFAEELSAINKAFQERNEWLEAELAESRTAYAELLARSGAAPKWLVRFFVEEGANDSFSQNAIQKLVYRLGRWVAKSGEGFDDVKEAGAEVKPAPAASDMASCLVRFDEVDTASRDLLLANYAELTAQSLQAATDKWTGVRIRTLRAEVRRLLKECADGGV